MLRSGQGMAERPSSLVREAPCGGVSCVVLLLLSTHRNAYLTSPYSGPVLNFGQSLYHSPVESWAWMGGVISDGSLRPCLFADKTRNTYGFPSARSKTAYRGDLTASWVFTRCQLPLPTMDCKDKQDLWKRARGSPKSSWREYSIWANQIIF